MAVHSGPASVQQDLAAGPVPDGTVDCAADGGRQRWCPLSAGVTAAGWAVGGSSAEPAYSTGMELDLTGGQSHG